MTTRTAYIRTMLHKEAEAEYNETCWLNMGTWLEFWVGQTVHPRPFGPEKRKGGTPPPDVRHDYILGYTSAADEYVLNWLLHQSRPDGWRLSRADFTVFLSQSQMNDETLVQRLRREGVATETVAPCTPAKFPGVDACDGAMLSRSDYVLETSLVMHNAMGSPSWDVYYRDSMRHGRPQQYVTAALSEAYYADRLTRKMRHTMRWGEYPHPKSEEWKEDHLEEWKNYKCPSCGKRCKRSKPCQTTGEYKAPRSWDDGVDTSAPRPPEFEQAWRTLSAEDVMYGFNLDQKVSQRFRNWNWKSVDIFSGD